MSPEQKVIMLGKVISKLDTLKFFMQLAWENKLIPQIKYIELSQKLEEIGKMLGGWRKGLQSPPTQPRHSSPQNKTLTMS
ncbi:MAG: four helix bundle protein [Candidatus Pacebacteria bacterium]|nr:four helix bundle protein [Candidatus Paceibacterota bacterium]